MSGLYRIGVISDTHGSLPPAVHAVFEGVEHIVHAGDYGGQAVLHELGAIAPLTAVRGNCDHAPDGVASLVRTTLGGQGVVVVHDQADVPGLTASDRVRIVISGHTHIPVCRDERGALHLNPGSATRPRGGHPPSVALIEIVGDQVSAHIIPLSPPRPLR